MAKTDFGSIRTGIQSAIPKDVRELMQGIPHKFVPKADYKGPVLRIPKQARGKIYAFKKFIFKMQKRIEDLEWEKASTPHDDWHAIAAIDEKIQRCLAEIAVAKNDIRNIKISVLNDQKSLDVIG